MKIMIKHLQFKRLTNFMSKASCFLIKSKKRRKGLKSSNFKRNPIKCLQFRKNLLQRLLYFQKQMKNQKKNWIDLSFKTLQNDLKIQKSQFQDHQKKCLHPLLKQQNLARQWKTFFSQTSQNLLKEQIFLRIKLSRRSTQNLPHLKRRGILMTI